MSEPQVVTTEPATVAFITMHGTYDTTPSGFQKLYDWVVGHGLVPAGMPEAVYLSPPSEDATWELWAPVAETAPRDASDEGIGIKRVEPATVASVMHVGSYEGLSEVYRELFEWVAANGYVVAGPPRERYYSPPDVPPEEYRTEVLIPVRPA